MPRRHSIPACTHCRESHLKCDRKLPVCTNCQRIESPKTCDLNKLEIRQSPLSAKARRQQRHSPLERHETRRIDDYDSPRDFPRPQTAPGAHGSYDTPSSRSLRINENGDQQMSQMFSRPSLAESDLTSSSLRTNFPLPQSRLQRRTIGAPVEQRVFQFYITHAGPWLDIVSSQGHFERAVPRLALNEPVLYYALMAYSSLVLHLIEGLEKSVHEEFQTLAITKLIPLLSHCAQADEALLATVVTLRMMEQFSEIGEDAQHHLRGASSLFTTVQHKWSPSMIDLRGVSFWIYVRESIRASFLNEQGCRFDLDAVDVNCIRDMKHEESWANYASYLLLKLCDACWGSYTPENRRLMRAEISEALNEWKALLPSVFEPWYYQTPRSDTFPTVKLLSPWHEIAWHMYYTSRVMLAVYSPSRPTTGSMLEMNRYIESDILGPARMACAICLSSPHIGCNLNGCHMIAWCGQFFTGKEEQRILYDFLKDFADAVKWPNRSCYERLQDIWDGKRTSWGDLD